jgi:hypothetical protein
VTSLLHLDSSANRSSESVSRQLTALFANTWRALHSSAGEWSDTVSSRRCGWSRWSRVRPRNGSGR